MKTRIVVKMGQSRSFIIRISRGGMYMPLTFAHPAAILPFLRGGKYFNFSALVLGSMSPDFEYFLRGRPSGEIGHTFVGFVVFNLPLVIIIYFIYRTYIHRTLFNHLPFFLQDTYFQKPNSTIGLKVTVFLYSALLAMLTHVVWDSFTHLNGFMVKNLSFLSYTFQIYGFKIPIFKFLQHGSTIVGLFAIIVYMIYRTAKNPYNDGGNKRPKQKVMYWCHIALFTILLFCLWYFVDQVSIESYGIIVVRIIDSALISLLVVSLHFGRFYDLKTVSHVE